MVTNYGCYYLYYSVWSVAQVTRKHRERKPLPRLCNIPFLYEEKWFSKCHGALWPSWILSEVILSSKILPKKPLPVQVPNLLKISQMHTCMQNFVEISQSVHKRIFKLQPAAILNFDRSDT